MNASRPALPSVAIELVIEEALKLSETGLSRNLMPSSRLHKASPAVAVRC
jgi:hypothetical protein